IFRHHCKAPPVGLRRPPSPVGLRRPPPRDIEVVVESALSLVVLVSALWNRRFRCRFSPLRFGFFRHWTFVFSPTASSFRPCLGLFGGLDALPFVCRRCPPHAQISQPKFMR